LFINCSLYEKNEQNDIFGIQLIDLREISGWVYYIGKLLSALAQRKKFVEVSMSINIKFIYEKT